jgi:FkbM family methyltransferase
MKHLTTIKDNKWVWPLNDENSWKYQNEYNDLAQHLLPYVKNKNIMIQAGGNCGYLLNTFIDHFNTIYTFEPDPINFYCLNNNISSQNVIKMQCCLGDDGMPVSTQQLIRPNKPNDTGGVHVSGKGNTPSIIIDNLNLPDCNLIQLDIEGYEYKALLGAISTIKKYKPVLCVEFCEKWLNRYNDNSEKVLGLIYGLGYKLVDEYGVDKIFIYNEL